MKRPPREVWAPAGVALLCAALLGCATIWSAKPLYGPLHAEFGWRPELLALAGLLSLAATAAVPKLWRGASPRRSAAGGLLACGIVALLAVPNLTHLWQLALALLALGVARGAALHGLWRAVRHGFGGAATLALLVAALVAGIWPAAGIVAVTVYRNSWREGAAACAALLLAVATPLAYVLLPGREAAGAFDGSPAPRQDEAE